MCNIINIYIFQISRPNSCWHLAIFALNFSFNKIRTLQLSSLTISPSLLPVPLFPETITIMNFFCNLLVHFYTLLLCTSEVIHSNCKVVLYFYFYTAGVVTQLAFFYSEVLFFKICSYVSIYIIYTFACYIVFIKNIRFPSDKYLPFPQIFVVANNAATFICVNSYTLWTAIL